MNPKLIPAVFLALIVSDLGAPAAEHPPGHWQSLFNGGNLDGWVSMNDGRFSVTNGVIHIGGGMGWLRTEQKYTNFVLEVEWRGLEKNYNSGFFIRAGLEGSPFPTNGWQVNLKQADLGALLKNKVILLSPKPSVIPEGAWAKFTLTALENNLALAVNGQKIWEHEFDAEQGFIGIQAEGKAMEFRNLRVQELPGGLKWDKLNVPAAVK